MLSNTADNKTKWAGDVGDDTHDKSGTKFALNSFTTFVMASVIYEKNKSSSSSFFFFFVEGGGKVHLASPDDSLSLSCRSSL